MKPAQRPRAKPRSAPATSKAPRITIADAAVRKATGRGWDQWFSILDRFNVMKNGHKAAAAHVHDDHDCPDWWSQMVVVNYEQARGLRVKHQTAAGFSVSASRVINAPAARAFDAVVNEKLRAAWLPRVTLEIRKATPHKSARITFIKGAGLKGYEHSPTSVEIGFYAKGKARCQVAIQHSKLRDADDAERMKAFWSKAAGRLVKSLNG